MDIILYFFRDEISGMYYFIYAFLCLFFMFAIIGYLFKQKYGKLEIKLNTSQVKVENTQVSALNSNVKNKKLSRKEQRELKKKNKQKSIFPQATPQSSATMIHPQGVNTTQGANIPTNIQTPVVTPNVIENQGQVISNVQPVGQSQTPIPNIGGFSNQVNIQPTSQNPNNVANNPIPEIK